MRSKQLLKCFTITIVSLALSGCTGTSAVFKPPPERKIKLQSRAFTPKAGIEKQLVQKLKTTPRKRVHTLVQFQKRLSLDDHKFLSDSDVLIERYLVPLTYEVSIRKGTVIDKGKLRKMIRWAGMYKPKDKLSRLLARKQFYDWAIDKDTGKVKLLVQFFQDIDKNAISKDLASLGLKGKRHGANNTWVVLADKNRIDQIIKLDSVRSVQQGPLPFLPLNDGGRRIANSDQAQQQTYDNPKPGYRKVSGNGIRIGICDYSLDEDHNDFDWIPPPGFAVASRVYKQRDGCHSHGTLVASVAAGNGFNSENNGFPAFSLRGHAPRARIGDYPMFEGNAQLYHDAIVNDDTDVTNHSYGQSLTVYDVRAESLDMIGRGDATDDNGNPIPARPEVWGAGNNGDANQHGNEEGYYAVFTSAKNTISVGSIDTLDGRISAFSSLGPTFDGRIKPDIVAPGCTDSRAGIGIRAARCGTQGYVGACGTSLAAPVVSGIIAMMMEQFHDTYGNLPDYPSTYKAMLIHSAKDMVKFQEFETREFVNPDTLAPVLYHAGPDFATGYGLVDAEGARELVTQQQRWKEASIRLARKDRTWCLSVPEGSKEIKVVIAWDDEPGAPSPAPETDRKIVNDLDLRLIAPNGKQYLPWTLDPLPLTADPGNGDRDPILPGAVDPAYRGVDRRNNVEMVSVCLPQAGIWKAKVRAFRLPNGNAQPYSLVSSHDILMRCPIEPDIDEICRLYPQVCDFCVTHPDKCSPRGPRLSRVRNKDIWIVDTRLPHPIDEICKYVIDCPGCKGPGWAYCPGWEMRIDDLPRDANIVVFNQDGKTLIMDTTNLLSRTLQIKQQRPGDQHFLLITDSNGKSYPKELKLRIGIKPL